MNKQLMHASELGFWFEEAPFDAREGLDGPLLAHTFSRNPGLLKLEVLVEDLPPSLQRHLEPVCTFLEERCRSIFTGVPMYTVHGIICRRPGAHRQDTHTDGGFCTLMVPLSGTIAPTLVWPSTGEWCCTASASLEPRLASWSPNEIQFIGGKRYHAGPGNHGTDPEFILYTHACPVV